MDSSVDFLKGTLDLMILKTLSWAPTHGYGIARWIEQCTSDTLKVEEGSLYPALYRLERKGWIESEWGLSEKNRRAKYYRLTTVGRRALKTNVSLWDSFAGAVQRVLASTDAPARA